jgi:5'-3' exonuclease
VVLFDRMRSKLVDEAGVKEKWGIAPASIPDWLALVGDTADGIPGIARWGAKSAAAVLAFYPHIEDIPDLAHNWGVQVRGALALASSLAEARKEAALYRTLATLRLDVPLKESVDELEWKGPDLPALTALAEQLGDTKLVELALKVHKARG